MRKLISLVFFSLLMLPSGALSVEHGLAVKGMRYFSYPAFTRIVFEVEASAPYVLTKSGDKRSLTLGAYEGPLGLKAALSPVHDGLVTGIESREEGGRLFIVLHLDAVAADVKDFVLHGPDRIVLDITRSTVIAAPASSTSVASPIVIVLDAGHGGRDTGIVMGEKQEKTVVLDFARALRKQLKARDPRFSIVLTRDKDQALQPEERAAISNAAGAALFVSIHEARGENLHVYIQDLDEGPVFQPASATSRDFLGFDAMHEQQEILWGGQQAAHVKESGNLGRKLMEHRKGNGNAEPEQAPLALLRAIDAAAVIVEFGNAQNLTALVDAVARGIEQYVREN